VNILKRRLEVLVLALVCALVVGGCGFSASDLPLPGGTDVGDDPIEVKAEFADVLDLVPQSTVKVNDVSVGKITDVTLDGETAVVTMALPADTELPANTVASIRQTSLLGEKFVDLAPPETGASPAALVDGAVIPLEATGRNPEVEEVLGALSLLLNGGGVGQLKTIAHELNLALEGREDNAKSVFRQVRSLMTQLDDNKGDIVAAIEGLNRLSLRVNDQMGTIDAALEELPGALETLDAQRGDLVRMLKALNRLGDVGVRVVRTSKQATIDTFQQLVPVLTQLSNAGDAFVNSFHVFLTYPFVDEVVGRDPQVARNLHMGDYTNLSIQLDLNVAGRGGGGGPIPPVEEACTTLQDVRDELGDQIPLDDLLEYLQGLDDLCRGAQQAIDKCLAKDGLDKVINCLGKKLDVTVQDLTQGVLDNTCEILGIPPGQCPQLPDGGGGGGGGGGGPILPDLPDLPFRAGFGPGPEGDRSGPTVRELMSRYDPALVSLLVPGMVTR
jgi:phospholipid/cholesterol/gamma-HCH transport system substrate-binding protein